MNKFLFYFFCTSALWGTVAAADTLDDRMKYWESQAFLCKDAGGSFPSKEGTVSPSNPSGCDDGDMTLFNGLLCAAGDARGCEGVRRAQGSDGRWWRSPRLVGLGEPGHASFSPDMALGVYNYIVKSNDKGAFERWLKWLDANRPCVITVAGSCLLQGWPRFCPDDGPQKGCTFRPTNCDDLEKVAMATGAQGGDLCRRVLQDFKIKPDYIVPTQQLALADALLNDLGFSLHLAAAKVFLLERAGITSVDVRAAAVALAYRQPKNPFFLYLAEGPTQKVQELVLNLCPTPALPSKRKFQWAWERDTDEKAWLDSMYWDCIFMGKLLGR